MLVTDGDEKVIKVLCIYYLVQFQEKQIKALLNSGSEVNTINSNFAWKLGLKVWKINVRAQKLNSSALETFGMVIVDFQVEDKVGRPRFF